MSTYSQIYLQIVFAVKYRQRLIEEEWEDQLYKYITGIVQNKGQKLLAVNGVSDHIHIFISVKPACSPSELVREIKKSTNEFINENNLSKYKFRWQEGFGVFSYHQSLVDKVIKYIMNQKEHHKKMNFKEEYRQFLEAYQIEFDERYVFEKEEDG